MRACVQPRSSAIVLVVVVVVVLFNVGEGVDRAVPTVTCPQEFRSGTYDGRSGIAYLVARLILSYTLTETPAQELA